MSIEESKVEAIFFAALEKQSPDDRIAYLDEVCASDPDLRQRVEALLNARLKLGTFLQGHAADMVATTSAPLTSERPDTQIGPYKLLQQIGEGGMGTVYMAEQTEPVKRKVALKVIKPGMDSGQVIARFEAERQALAMMDHVNIARVLDAGTTEHGRPYFVMELVNGVSITKYCDDNRLTPRERLELFVPVCQAIQHAHQKGIIHRDIKPSNVMVTLYDGKPVPKVIDFGVAKATEQKLTERTLFTQYGTMVGTLEYMSPEQAEMSALGVDTRSDIYSLGVLLYELLTGSTPLSRKQIKEAAFAEILRLIKEEEPQKPSTRLSESGEALASISARRHTEPAKLSKLMRGELDWVAMKTLEKDRNRRYETANGLAADVLRYLNDEPVQACPPSAAYRFRKFVRRNPGVAGLVSTALVLLVVLTIAAISLARQREQQLVDASLRNNELLARYVASSVLWHLEHLSQAVLQVAEEKKLRELLLPNSNPDGRRDFSHDIHERYNNPRNGFTGSASDPPFASWLFQDKNGTITGCWPENTEVVGKSFEGRDYFTGALRHAHATGRPAVHISRVFPSENDGRFKFAISVPVCDGENLLGVVAATVDPTTSRLGPFRLDAAGHGLFIVLAGRGDTEPPRPEAPAVTHEYLILLHPAKNTHGSVPIHANAELLHAVYQPQPGDELVPSEAVEDVASRIAPNYDDPLTEWDANFAGRWLAGFAPVGNTELVVIVQQRYDDTVHPGLTRATDLLLWSAAVLIGGLVLTSVAWLTLQRNSHQTHSTTNH